jgi:hypothetical protein
MLTINARKFVRLPTKTIWSKLRGDFLVEFEDGVLPGSEKDVVFSHYVWEFHRKYPKTPLLKNHFLPAVLKDGVIGSKTHLSLIRNVLFSVYDTYRLEVKDPQVLLARLARMGYVVANNMYNDFSEELEAFVGCFDILDFIQITRHEGIVNAISEMKPTQEGIDGVYKVAKAAIKSDPALAKNPLVQATNAGVVRVEQLLQCCVIRGYLTDINSAVFPRPILTNFTRGIHSIADIAMESRSAAKALKFSESPLQKSEYFSRRQQLVCMNVRHLHQGDCGSTKYLNWFVTGLKTIQGKYYLDEMSGVLKVVTLGDTHLLGTSIRMRSVVGGCAHPDPYGICGVCFGQLSDTILPGTNIGHHCCVSEMQKVSQNVLSIKHHDGSSVVEGISLDGKEARYLWATEGGSTYYLNQSNKRFSALQLLIKPEQAPSLTDLMKVDDVRKLDPVRIGVFDNITLIGVDRKSNEEVVSLHLTLNKRQASMTHDLLDHIRRVGWTISNQGQFLVDMKEWDFSKPLMSLPIRHFNMSDHQQEIENFLEKEDKAGKYAEAGVDVMLADFHHLVNKKLDVNLAILEVVLLANMISDPEKRNFRIPKCWDENLAKGTLRQMYNDRSMSALMAFQGHKQVLTDPNQALLTNRPDHPFDWLLLPGKISSYKYKNGMHPSHIQ